MEASSSSHSEPANGSPNREAGDTAGLSMQELSAAIDPDEDTRGKVITDYLLANVAEFRKLSELRKKGWENPAGDEYFAQQRARAQRAGSRTWSGAQTAKRAETRQPETVDVLHTFNNFSTVQLFKPTKAHAKKSSFYMLASNIQAEHPEAVKAIAYWKNAWKVATFGSDEEHMQLDSCRDGAWANKMMDEFGPVLISLGKKVWDTQAQALTKAPFIKGSPGRPKAGRQ